MTRDSHHKVNSLKQRLWIAQTMATSVESKKWKPLINKHLVVQKILLVMSKTLVVWIASCWQTRSLLTNQLSELLTNLISQRACCQISASSLFKRRETPLTLEIRNSREHLRHFSYTKILWVEAVLTVINLPSRSDHRNKVASLLACIQLVCLSPFACNKNNLKGQSNQ